MLHGYLFKIVVTGVTEKLQIVNFYKLRLVYYVIFDSTDRLQLIKIFYNYIFLPLFWLWALSAKNKIIFVIVCNSDICIFIFT